MGSIFRRTMQTAVLLLAVFAGNLSAQTLGTVTGEVKDASGAAVAGTAITARNIATNGIRNATTNEEGIYNIPALVPGMYEIKAEHSGFKSSSRGNIVLLVLQTARVAFTVEIGQVSETVEVTFEPPGRRDSTWRRRRRLRRRGPEVGTGQR